MAAEWKVNTNPSPHSRLRSQNYSLLRNLQENQNKVWSVLNDMNQKSSKYRDSFRPETSFTFRGLDRTPVSVQSSEYRTISSEYGITSTPKGYQEALGGAGNDRRTGNSAGHDKTPSASILLTPGSRKKKSPKKGLRVSFKTDDSKEDRLDTDLHRRSLLGYDWIAGILDNESYLAEKRDDFFEDLKEFRRVNKEECYSQTYSENILTPYRTTPRKINTEFEKEKEDYTCSNTYRLNDRLFPERVHDPNVSCSVCKTKPEAEYETQGSYVRVSVPRSTLLSPYKIKPHRRVSYDPTDTIGLSSHCLTGWESSKPAVVPPPVSLDLKASLHQSKPTLDASRIGCLSPPSPSSTKELIDHSNLMRYGLQVLDRQRGSTSTKPHTTQYPAY